MSFLIIWDNILRHERQYYVIVYNTRGIRSFISSAWYHALPDNSHGSPYLGKSIDQGKLSCVESRQNPCGRG
jgi:hypothetical protein